MKTQGWLKGSDLTPIQLVKSFEDLPLASIIFTDISKDGMMAGPNIEATSDLARSTKIPVCLRQSFFSIAYKTIG